VYFVYLLECADGSYYCGYTGNKEQRVEQHNKGAGSKYTRTRLPVKMVYSEQWKTRALAMKREREIKKCSRIQKEELVRKQ
jgi:putative endonuclease